MMRRRRTRREREKEGIQDKPHKEIVKIGGKAMEDRVRKEVDKGEGEKGCKIGQK